ncbi:hypothetical protein KY290_021038 [Solanum tuberosum]|uniref:Uncharacterized protein n=1 Tax=Solanum tuberosum TaxID=4113 RepID=A0ABQ7V0D4_SOLTU|nr:hypothetical protein KY290_021038 [Solanum tuberosum]
MSSSSSPLELPLSKKLKLPVHSISQFLPQKNIHPHRSVGLVRLLNLSHPILKWWRLLYSTLVLSGKESQNSEALSVVKPTLETPYEDLEVVSRAESSSMSERFLEEDLPEGKGTKSNILATTEELVADQSLALLRGDIQLTLLEQELRSPEQVPHSAQPVFDQTLKSFDVDSEEEEKEETPLVWRRKGVRGANVANMTVLDLGGVDPVPEAKLDDKPSESERKRKRKGKRKNGRSSDQRRRKKKICD